MNLKSNPKSLQTNFWTNSAMILLQVTNIFALTLFICHCTTAQQNVQISDDKLVVSLYYESLCPDCIDFISNQVSKARASIGNYFEMEFVPFGNAQILSTSPLTVKCQHGPNECQGNKMHACAIKYIPKSSISQFIVCTMSTKDPPNAGEECARSLRIDFRPIQSCATSDEGDILIFHYGLKTNDLNPPHQYVPWLLFNGDYSKDDNDKADEDLVRVICTKLRKAPDACNSVDLI